jgi:magnesium-transporting ATPase (P-type)
MMQKFSVNEQNVKSEPDPFLLAKTLVVNGEGWAIVCAVGQNSYSGSIEQKLHIEDD